MGFLVLGPCYVVLCVLSSFAIILLGKRAFEWRFAGGPIVVRFLNVYWVICK